MVKKDGANNVKICKKSGIIVESIVPGSPAAYCNINRGDQLLAINGIRPRDLIAYRYLCAEENLNLKTRRQNGQPVTYQINKGYDTDLGIVFSTDCFDGVKHCRNKCIFCFVDQLPGHLRSTLYEKDDDYRQSFLHGNYITLTNLQENEISRILNLKLSPLYISVHTTDPELRGRMLGLKRSAPVLDMISRFAEEGIKMHIQIVLCPDWNDGAILERTISDLAVFWPQVASVGIVPVGLTKFRQHLPYLRSITPTESRKLISRLGNFQQAFCKKYGVSFVYLADEFYLKARYPFPPYEQYDGFPQLENGIGPARLFYEDFRKLRCFLPKKARRQRRLFIATSQDGGRVLLPVIRRLRLIKNLDVNLISIPSTFFGPRITVTGLLTGQDLLWGLRDIKGEDVLLPRILLRKGTSLFLDGLDVREVEHRSGCAVHLLDPTAAALVEHICMLGGVRL
jgi:putative radical SAM enzyme (TIGR03279 family)